MPKIAVYIPKQEMRAIDQWRHRINFSRVFKQALAAEIDALSRSAEAPEDRLSAAAEYYRQKLREDSGELVGYGQKLGTEQMLDCKLSPAQIRGLLAIDPGGENFSADDTSVIEAVLEPSAKDIAEFADRLGIGDQQHPAWRTAVYRGFLRGVRETWKTICERM